MLEDESCGEAEKFHGTLDVAGRPQCDRVVSARGHIVGGVGFIMDFAVAPKGDSAVLLPVEVGANYDGTGGVLI